MRILAIDTASTSCSVAIWQSGGKSGRLLSSQQQEMQRGQAEALMPMILDVMREADLDFHELDCLASTIGPGSFTGLRVGLATARGLALSTGLPLAGITCFDAVAFQIPAEDRLNKNIVVILESKRDELFVQHYSADETLTPSAPATYQTPEEIAASLPRDVPIILAGDASEKCREFVSDMENIYWAASDVTPNAISVAQYSATLDLEKLTDIAPPNPLYIREADAEKAKNLRPMIQVSHAENS